MFGGVVLRPFPCRDFKPPPSLAPASCSGAASCAASDTIAARPAPRRWRLRERTVQGVSGARWRCRPSVQESPFSGKIQGVEAVEVGGSGGGCALAPADPVGCEGRGSWPPGSHPGQLLRPPTLLRLRRCIRVSYPVGGWLHPFQLAPANGVGPANLRRLQPQRRGIGWPYRAYRVGGGGVGRPPWNPLSTARSRALRWWRSADPVGGWLVSAPADPAARGVGWLAPWLPSVQLAPASGQRCRLQPQRRGR